MGVADRPGPVYPLETLGRLPVGAIRGLGPPPDNGRAFGYFPKARWSGQRPTLCRGQLLIG